MEVPSDLTSILVQFVQNYPAISTAIFIMGSLRAIFKPIMTILEEYVNRTESTSDNEKLEAFKNSKVYKSISWLVDLFASVKLPKSK